MTALAAIFIALGVPARMLAPVRGRVAGTALIAAGWLMLLTEHTPINSLDNSTMIWIGTMVGVALAAILVWITRGHPGIMLVGLALTLTVRIPIEVAGDTSRLLIGVYAIAGYALVRDMLVLPAPPGSLLRDGRLPESAMTTLSPSARIADILVAVMVSWTALSLLWTASEEETALHLALLIVPFAIVYIMVRTLWTSTPRAWRTAAGAVFGSVMLLNALIGIYQHATHRIWQNPKIINANEFSPVFRVNGTFWDPNIYGRYLVAAILIVAISWVTYATARRVLPLRPGGHVIALVVLSIGLVYSFSLSSFLALAGGAVAALMRMLGRAATIAVVAIIAGTLFVVLVTPLGPRLSDEQGRMQIARDGTNMALEHPLRGVGAGAFEPAYVDYIVAQDERVGRLRTSHTTPVTVAAELGIVGFATYLAMLAAMLATGWRATQWRRSAEIVAYPRAAAWLPFSVLLALIVHSLFYAGFFEDPLTWVLFGLVVATAPETTRSRRYRERRARQHAA